jgi:hypothetical protein
MNPLAEIYDQAGHYVGIVYSFIEVEQYAAEGYYVEFLR